MVVQSQFIEMFGDPITNSKECVVKKGYELFAFSSGKANTRANLNDSYKYDCYGGNGTTGKSKEYLIDYSTLVIGRVGEYCGSVHCTPTYSWITDNAIYIKEFNDKDLDINYLYYLFLFLDLHRFSAKTGQPKITQEALLGIDYICPGIEEQEKYVTFAHQADKSKFDGLKSQFIEMFYHSNPKGWPVTSFEGFAKIDANMTTDYKKYADYPHIGVDSIEKGTGILSGYRTVKEDNVISGKYVFTPKHIIYSKIRPNLNKVALPDFDGVCSADAYPILPKDGICNRLYLAYLMRSNHFLEYILKFSARSSMPKVNREQINGYQAPLPPIKLQEDFSYIVGQADKSKYLS